MLKVLGLSTALVVSANADSHSLGGTCGNVAVGDEATASGFFYPGGTSTRAAYFVVAGDKATRTGQFCALGEFYDPVTVGNLLMTAEQDDPTVIAYGRPGADEKGGFLLSKPDDMAYVCDIDRYVNDENEVTVIEVAQPIQFSAEQKEDSFTSADGKECKYVVSSAAVAVGSDEMGGTIATATYGNIGEQSCMVHTNTFWKPETNGCFNSCSETSAEFCIGETASGLPAEAPSDTCSAREFVPGATKFSLFLRTSGSNFDWNNAKCDSGKDATHVGIRTMVFIGSLPATTADITFKTKDGDKTVTDVGSSDITSIAVGDIEFSMITQYNYGSLTSEGGANTDGQGDVKIRYASGESDEKFYLDYFFDVNHLQSANQWAAYDPEVKNTGKSDSSAASSHAASAIAASLGAIAAVWAF